MVGVDGPLRARSGVGLRDAGPRSRLRPFDLHYESGLDTVESDR
jgi:hypothetical protein